MKYFSLLSLLFSLSIFANDCAEDATKFCQGVDPGRGQIARCLSDYANQLSPKCFKELKTYKTKTGDMNPCFEDLAEFCTSIPNGKLEYCLMKNENKLSAKCSADFKKKKGGIIVKDVCAQDVVENCYSAVPGPEGSILRCLIKIQPKLAGFCRKSVETKVAAMKEGNACFDETEKLCPTQVRFIDIQECMEKKITTLSPNCKKLVQREIDKTKANPCYKDLQRHCVPGISADDQNRCLLLNEKEISNACKQYRTTQEGKVKKMIELCEADRVKFCAKAPLNNGMVTKCLRENKAKLTSKECAALL